MVIPGKYMMGQPLTITIPTSTCRLSDLPFRL
jgi:hypothetical protein